MPRETGNAIQFLRELVNFSFLWRQPSPSNHRWPRVNGAASDMPAIKHQRKVLGTLVHFRVYWFNYVDRYDFVCPSTFARVNFAWWFRKIVCRRDFLQTASRTKILLSFVRAVIRIFFFVEFLSASVCPCRILIASYKRVSNSTFNRIVTFSEIND